MPDQSLNQPLKVHWRLSQGGNNKIRTRQSMAVSQDSAQTDLTRQVSFARQAERLGFDSLLVDFGLNKPDSTLLAMAVGTQTQTIKFIIACRSGVISPTYFVQQLNTLSQFIPGRFSLNVVAGH
ncbi:MAG: alkanesulfonate monooxygenase, partial [Alteromonadaceae bacterium]